ncbi:hypothetical protein AU210_016353 [Fusarium oxysporum f. sp. radicis-cucumerinum]|uniref:Transcription factor domain-containing protein n=1 Tax=Fusarium oxysporum f. sp. radicis-cucumerinum TaxID=327505 RepID=A0A2H3G0D1_FUSOX|nr:hypothetical protein AU210_016353 [Fusarium oxysporum f. sp. radicis-cucumerinum]
MVPNRYEQPGMMLTTLLEKGQCDVWEGDTEFDMESTGISDERLVNHIREDTCSVISDGSTMFDCFEKENKTVINSDGNGPPSSSSLADDVATFQAERCLEWLMGMGKPPESGEPKSEKAQLPAKFKTKTLPGTVDPLGKHLNGEDHTQSLNAQNDWSEQATHFLQLCFVEVATWADSFFWARDFGQLVLKHASESLMVLNAVFACATVTSGEIEKSLFSYDYATEHLSEASRETVRNSAKCAVASIVLSIYETKRGEYEQSLRRIGNSRAFMQECQWNAESTGFGLACFWLNIEIEVNNCLATNRQTVWSPDELGMVPLSVDKNEHTEQIWAQSTLCVLAEVVNFRAGATRSENAGPQHEQTWAGLCLQWRKCATLHNFWLMAKTSIGCVETTYTSLDAW